MTENKLAQYIAAECSLHGGSAFYVGGYVRDKFLGIENKDIDIEIHGIQPARLEEILSHFGVVEKIGASFGIYKIHGSDIDISLPRKERKIGDKHYNFDVTIDPFLGKREAAKRRDFTINSIMENVITGEVYDPFGGIEDIQNRIIRHVNSKSFIEDPLRVFRAAQFAARFDFSICKETINLCKTIDVRCLSKERVFEEMKKALTKSLRPSTFFNALKEMEKLDFWFSDLNVLNKKDWDTAMSVLDAATKYRKLSDDDFSFMLAALGKLSPLIIKKLTDNSRVNTYVSTMDYNRMLSAIKNNVSVYETNKIFDSCASPKDLTLLCKATGINEVETKFLEERQSQYLDIVDKPFVMGRDLIDIGIAPGKIYSVLLFKAHEMRLAGYYKEKILKQFKKEMEGNKT